MLSACEQENKFEQDENVLSLEEELKLIEQKENIVLSSEGYLMFKNHEVYDSINKMVDKMTNEEFITWEDQSGFTSAQTYLLNACDELDSAQTVEEYNEIKKKYSENLFFEEDGSIKLPFYATAWSRILNVEGIMKVGNVLFKFDNEKEYMIFDGETEDINNLDILSEDTTKVRIYEPGKSTKINSAKLKSAIAGEWNFPTIISDNGKKRLKGSVQTIINYYTGYGLTSTYYTEMWLEFKLEMLQEAKSLFNKWSPNKTVYCINCFDLHYEYYKHGSANNNTGPTGSYTWGDLVVYNDYIGEQQCSAEMKGTCVLSMIDYYECTRGYHPQTDLYIYRLDLNLWSRGVGYDKRYHVDDYNNI